MTRRCQTGRSPSSSFPSTVCWSSRPRDAGWLLRLAALTSLQSSPAVVIDINAVSVRSSAFATAKTSLYLRSHGCGCLVAVVASLVGGRRKSQKPFEKGRQRRVEDRGGSRSQGRGKASPGPSEREGVGERNGGPGRDSWNTRRRLRTGCERAESSEGQRKETRVTASEIARRRAS